MDLQFWLAQTAGMTAFRTLRLFGSGATALPGLITTTLDPHFVAKKAERFQSIIITGTNGKTTTSNQLAAILRQAGWHVTHNRSGSNLLRGVASTLLEQPSTDWAIFETDEADFPAISTQVKPKVVVLLNLFRDQMDRYAEIDKTAKRWEKALAELAEDTVLIVNADDPRLAWLGEQAKKYLKRVVFLGIDDTRHGKTDLKHTADSILSPASGAKLTYSSVFFSHLGIYEDSNSSFRRPKLDLAINDIKLDSFNGATFVLHNGEEKIKVSTQVPGLFNVYNQGVAAAVAWTLAINPQVIKEAVEAFTSVFGRFEKISLTDGRSLILFLIKNPVGFDQVISLLTQSANEQTYLIAINDKLADGTDVSWLWDAQVEALAPTIKTVVTAGTRGHEMALRLSYAGTKSEKIKTENDLEQALATILKETKDPSISCLLTYTAMLEFRRLLVKQNLVQPFYKEKAAV